MEVIRFTDKHIPWITECLELHGVEVPKSFPAIGYITMHYATPVAYAFLRQVEGGYGQLDGLVSNPYMTSEDRHRGIDRVVTTILAHAALIGITKVMAFTGDASTLERSKSHGFQQLPGSLIAIDLGPSGTTTRKD